MSSKMKCKICNTRYAQPNRQFCWPCGGALLRDIQQQSIVYEQEKKKREAQSDYESFLEMTTKTFFGVRQI
jgi:hypothetical protein